MEVHEGASIPRLALLGVDEHAGEAAAEAHVVGASSPVKGAALVLPLAPLARVACAVLQLPLAAGACDGVHHPRRRDGVHERRLATA